MTRSLSIASSTERVFSPQLGSTPDLLGGDDVNCLGDALFHILDVLHLVRVHIDHPEADVFRKDVLAEQFQHVEREGSSGAAGTLSGADLGLG